MVLLAGAKHFRELAVDDEETAAHLGLIPDFSVSESLGKIVSLTEGPLGGSYVSRFPALGGRARRTHADEDLQDASRTATIGSYVRREQEWAHQRNVAAGEINQILKQLRAAQIREYVTEREWHNHQQQIEHAKEIEDFLADDKNGKKGNAALYAWMKREVKGLHARAFQLAFDIARKAERALQHELGDRDATFLQFGYLSGKEGLLAGDKLYLDIKRMEMAYHDQNKREYELTKHVSLRQLDPEKLLTLRAKGECELELPEELFDLDCPGHYFRRIRSVALSVPCVAGPYTSVNCTLTLTKSTIRTRKTPATPYAPPQGAEDERFTIDYTVRSIVTSTGQNDSGLFEANLRDERYLPFEGAGAISTWKISLPVEPAQFDHDTITDVVLHLRYTAREGGKLLGDEASKSLNLAKAGSTRLFSVRHDFPAAWAAFKNAPAAAAYELRLVLSDDDYPYWSREGRGEVKEVKLYAKEHFGVRHLKPEFKPADVGEVGMPQASLRVGPDATAGDLPEGLATTATEKSPFTLFFDSNAMTELWLAVTWDPK